MDVGSCCKRWWVLQEVVGVARGGGCCQRCCQPYQKPSARAECTTMVPEKTMAITQHRQRLDYTVVSSGQ
ncbi:hypothetical protein ACOMHN_010861 [Nucella lapillus]